MSKNTEKQELTGSWRRLHGAFWLVGLAILFYTGRFWPGILVLVALSMVLEGVLLAFQPKSSQPEQIPAAPQQPAPAAPVPQPQIHRAELLPTVCPKCGAPVRGQEVKWTGPQSADCSYCGANLPMNKE